MATAVSRAASSPGAMSKRWMLTIWNFDEPHYRPLWKPADMAYLVWQIELGDDTRGRHLQVYVRFHNRKRFESVKRIFERNDAHLEIAVASEEECKHYCTKGDTRVEAGLEHGEYKPDEGRQGKRTDLDTIARRIRAGDQMAAIAVDHPGDYIRYHRGLEAFANVVRPPPAQSRDVQVIVLWGPTGTGKTHRIMTEFPDAFCVEPGRDPWDGYTGQATIFFDEFDPALWPINVMKKVLDKWKYRLQRRYNNAFAEWTRVAICAQSSPVAWYDSSPSPDQAALRRRIASSCRLVESQELSLSQIMLLAPNPAF